MSALPKGLPYTLYEGELPMTSEMTEKSYLAVRCFYCSEPVRLSIRLLELCHADSDSATAELQGQCQVFILRCDVCSKESRYLNAEIETWEGNPRQKGDVNPSIPRRYPKALRKAAGQ
jgi:hypothetical protein